MQLVFASTRPRFMMFSNLYHTGYQSDVRHQPLEQKNLLVVIETGSIIVETKQSPVAYCTGGALLQIQL
jgi:hypothetical protein